MDDVGENGLGITGRNSVVEIPPSLRFKLLPALPIRPYGDLGVGVALSTTRRDGWMFEEANRGLGLMSRSALGVELGRSNGIMVMIEPLSVRTYHFDRSYVRVGSMVGVGYNF